jgi:tRNA G37 N-methylase Trm5
VLQLQKEKVELRKRQTSDLEMRPKIIDLFAGVGGFSLGAIRAGFDVAAAISRGKKI